MVTKNARGGGKGGGGGERERKRGAKGGNLSTYGPHFWVLTCLKFYMYLLMDMFRNRPVG